ncbi:TetR/AcrR family transcriptional regulator [Caldimonas tepidiphila]|uniref:TetR/AcrR family transcriptional regulator n=1 Tax=Caldimonas tepidiphila TaxID=2315841 RepID=UPI000E5B338C|nr:TetR/AcrR family transcriptional regulator [Caldimonas tepidiphila]
MNPGQEDEAAQAVPTPRERRQRAVSEARRDLILDAARSAFLESGLEGVSMREIARRAGYTAGALYTYFASKEEVYAALLDESLERLLRRVAPAAGAAPAGRMPAAARREAAEAALRSSARAFFEFYAENPRDLDLGFYLFHGMRPRGLTPGLNERLNARLRDALAPARAAMEALGLDEEEAQTELTALFAHIVGLLVLSHTGRIRMFRRESAALFERYLEALVVRCRARHPRDAR